MANPINKLIADRVQIECEMFRRGIFGFITRSEHGHHAKQEEALRILTDDTHTEFLYGGAAGGAKSWTGCTWLAFMSLCHPGTKWFIGREELKRLRESTLITFFKVCAQYGIVRDQDFKYNGQDHYIQFTNGSRIDLLDLRYLPSDPLYERYGSVEYTGGWIEEGGEVNFGAYDTLKTRIGRHLNDKYGILRKLFISCNPKKNWMHSTFYKPAKAGTLPPYRIYLAALVQDNPFIEKDYIEALKSTTDKVKKERLLKGNWDYDDNPNALCSHDDIREIFYPKIHARTGIKYITRILPASVPTGRKSSCGTAGRSSNKCRSTEAPLRKSPPASNHWPPNTASPAIGSSPTKTEWAAEWSICAGSADSSITRNVSTERISRTSRRNADTSWPTRSTPSPCPSIANCPRIRKTKSPRNWNSFRPGTWTTTANCS